MVMGRLELGCLRVRLINSRPSIGQSVTSAGNCAPRRPKSHYSCLGQPPGLGPRGGAGVGAV